MSALISEPYRLAMPASSIMAPRTIRSASMEWGMGEGVEFKIGLSWGHIRPPGAFCLVRYRLTSMANFSRAVASLVKVKPY